MCFYMQNAECHIVITIYGYYIESISDKHEECVGLSIILLFVVDRCPHAYILKVCISFFPKDICTYSFSI